MLSDKCIGRRKKKDKVVALFTVLSKTAVVSAHKLAK